MFIACSTDRLRTLRIPSVIIIAAICAACGREQATQQPQPRMVRTIAIERPPPAADVVFTGHIEAKDQAALSFRISGRLAERSVGIGANVREGDVVARIDPETELNNLLLAQAALATAQGALRQATNQFNRQSHLLDRGHASREDFEFAEQGRTAAQAQVKSAQARLRNAEEVVGFTTLKADAPGVVTATGAEPGEVVQAGRMIVQLARRDGRDAVFEVPADLARSATVDSRVVVNLASDPSVSVNGRVREIAPQADPVTRTFRIRVGLTDPPQAFRLGTTVSGRISGDQNAVLTVPSSALLKRGADTGAWVVNAESLKVSFRKLDVLSSTPARASIKSGLSTGDIVVTAGANLLQEGQVVRLSGTQTR